MLPSLLTLSVTYDPQAMAMTHTHANNQSKRSLDTKERVKTYKTTQKTTANVVMPTLIQLHWLPVSYRIKFKLCSIIHAIHYGRSLAYLTETVQSVSASRSRCGLCSSSTSSMDYSLPRLRMKFGERAFSHAGPAAWNALPDHIHTVADPVKFWKLLKSHYFSQAF